MISISVLDINLKLFDFRRTKRKGECKMVLPLWRASLEKYVVFCPVEEVKELFLELALKLSARGRGRRCPFCETSLPSLCKRGQTDEKLEFACTQQRLL